MKKFVAGRTGWCAADELCAAKLTGIKVGVGVSTDASPRAEPVADAETATTE